MYMVTMILNMKSECNTLLLLVTEDTGSGLTRRWKEFQLIQFPAHVNAKNLQMYSALKNGLNFFFLSLSDPFNTNSKYCKNDVT